MLRLIRRGLKESRASLHAHNIRQIGINNPNLVVNPSVPELYEIALLMENPADPFTKQTVVSNEGALCAYSGRKTGREPQNLRLVKERETEAFINWGKTNIPMSEKSFRLVERLTVDYINHKTRCLVVDGYAGWDPANRIKVRTYTSRSYHALFMRNMLIRPTLEELENHFSKGVDMHIFNAGDLQASKNIEGITSDMVTALNLKEKKLVIMGSQFAGQMKKGIFKMLQYYYPRKGILTMHASITEAANGDTSLLCGLSGTGKTALVMNSSRRLLGDDEACWGDHNVFAIEGGCYAKCVNLDKDKERDIYEAIKFGTVLENVEFKAGTRDVNYNDISITENTRASYPMDFIPSRKIPAVGSHPKHIIFLTSDALGVLPPLARLTHEQGAFQFLSGYTAKLAGTQISVKEPQATFSACFGEIFIPLPPMVYVDMFYKKVKQHNCKIWLLNTGWTRGKYGSGQRIEIEQSLRMLEAIYSGQLDSAPSYKFKYFGFEVPTEVKGIDPTMLRPVDTWQNAEEYEQTLRGLVGKFRENIKKYENVPEEVLKAGPSLE